MSMGNPGEGHQKLAPMAGEFVAHCTMWMEPGKPPITYTGSMKSEWVLGGRFLKQTYEGPFKNGRLHGVGYWGFNNHSCQYEGVWMDTASTIMQKETGTVDASGRVFSMSGEMACPMGGVMTKRSVITVRSDEEHLFEMYFRFPGTQGEMKVMEAVYRRK